MFDFLAKPFGIMMEFIYKYLAFENYALAIVVFTILIKLLLMPLQIKQQRSMIKQQEIQPELQELQRTYANDRNKMAEEQQKLYAKHNISMTAGCLPMLIQFPLILVLYQIIRQPLTYISGIAAATIKTIAEAVKSVAPAVINNNIVDELVLNKTLMTNEAVLGSVSQHITKAQVINMDFFGIFNLGDSPSILFTGWDQWPTYWPLIFIPLLSFGSAVLLQFITTSAQRKAKKEQKKTEGRKGFDFSGLLMKAMPLLSLVIAFTVPAGLGWYWTVSNLLTIVQTLIINKVIAKQKEGRL
ncbi:MAG: YidC/Oxa1 family membrane protein insertase [Firmicutes bacterium]|nr:YidC/Oxa1 family membrane protein insertase [Bacillota bacterium]